MSIEFHCDHCSKLIRAPEDAGGRRAKCPYCQQSVYVPSQVTAEDEIPLAPLDDGDEAEQRRLAEEARRTAEELRADRRPPADRVTAPAGPTESAMPHDLADTGGEVEDRVVDYLLLMRESQLVQAEEVLAELLRDREAARQAIERLAADAVPPPALADVPSGVYQGFLKNLRAQLK